MTKMTWVLGALWVSALSLTASAQETGQKEHEGGHDSEAVTVEGEIVDMGCYLGHGAKGEDHKSCALRCIAGGMPMGLLTAQGKLYLLTMSHDDADPFNAAKEMAAETVKVTGPVHERDGIVSLEVTTVERET